MLNAASLAGNYRRMSIYATCIIFIGVILASGCGLFSWFDALFYDLHFKIRGERAPSGQVVLVYMDEQSAERLNRHQASWSRHNMATALHNLTVAGSEIIALDMIFSAPAHNPQDDAELAATISACNNVVLARIAAVPGLGAVEPLAIFQHGMIGDGFIDLPLDRDNYLRKVRFLTATPLADGALQLTPSFALEIARTYRNLDYQFDFSHADFFTMGSSEQQQLKLPYPELLINYYGTDTSFTRLNYADIVNNQFDPQQVAGKIILIGSRLKTEKDVFSTPFTRFNSLQHQNDYRFAKNVTTVQDAKEPGVACHAHAIETIINQAFIVPLAYYKSVLLLLTIAGVGHLLIFRQRKTAQALFNSLMLLLSILTLCQLAFQWGILINATALLTLIILQLLASFALLKMLEKRHSDWVTSVFGKYVSPSVVSRLVQGEITPNMEGQTQELTILFADLRSFSSISEQLTAQQTTQLLNTFFAAMIPQIQQLNGTVDKLIGDAIMAIFGAPISYPRHAQHAAEAALNMLSTLEQLQSDNKLPGLQQLRMGIGINSGDVTLGNLGCEEFMNYTVIGDNVNLASRLEGLNKVYGCNIIISQHTAIQLDATLYTRELDQVIVKGRGNATTIYELVGFSAQISAQQHKLLGHFAQGLELYRAQNFDAAEHCFNQALALDANDGPSQLFLRRIADLQATPPDADWQPITRFQRK
ncbi:MAG: CHASE2 domain-containing protein [Desulfuromonas sp.]|nr:CHASE2 domain-containing protein [Desulfuromonas sp.]